MKKLLYSISVALMISFLYPSCDSLDLSPEDYYGSGNFWDNSSQVEGYMTGLHTYLRNNYAMFYVMGELRGGTQRVGTSSQNTSLDYSVARSQLLTKDNTVISDWNGLYTPIMRINLAISEIENGCDFLSESDRNLYLAQAYGMRALYYFMLYRTYGGVPIVTTVDLLEGKNTAEKFYIERATPQATMQFLKDDIKKSEDYFGTNVSINKNKWSKYATLMLKAEIHMWAAKAAITNYTPTGAVDLNVAKTALNQISGFSLLDDFGSIFSASNKNNDEIIFALKFADNEATNWGYAFLYQQGVFIDQVYGRDGVRITHDTLNLKGTGGVFRHEYKEDFWKSYDAKDTRRDATFLEYYQSKDNSGNLSGFGCVMLKGVGSINSNNNRIYNSDIVVYRYADVVLMLAEIENGLTGSCASYINQIRERAYGGDYNASVAYTDGTYAQNELAILKERDKEFVWEGKRWFDVVRMRDANGKSLAFSSTANYPATSPILIEAEDAHKLLWPVNASTLNLNPLLTQTPGY